jgi:hypothetical protein
MTTEQPDTAAPEIQSEADCSCEDLVMAEAITEQGNLTVALTAMANEFGAAAARRTQRADQVGADASAMWSIAMTTPTMNASLGYRTAIESGSGRTRAETNAPDNTAAQKTP